MKYQSLFIAGNLFTDEENTWTNSDVVLLNDVKNAMDGACNQRECFEQNILYLES